MSAKTMILWGVVSLVAVVVITAVVTKQVVRDRWRAERANVTVVTTSSVDAVPREPAPSASAETKPLPDTSSASPAAPQFPSPAPTTAPKAGTAAELDMETIVAALTPEQRNKLEEASQKAFAERVRQEARYQMPDDAAFFSLNLAGRSKPELKLSDDQQAQLKALADKQKALLDARLGGVWARMDEVAVLMDAKGLGGAMIPADQVNNPLVKEWRDLFKQQDDAKSELSGDYEQQRMSVLNESQRRHVESFRSQLSRFSKAGQ
jgi:Spy/CpxP family protein refolding chaperone